MIRYYKGFSISEDLNENWHVTCQHEGKQAATEHAMFRTEAEAFSWVDNVPKPTALSEQEGGGRG